MDIRKELGEELVDNARREFVSGLESVGNVVAILKETDVSNSTPVAEVMKITKKLSLPIRQAHEYFTKSVEVWEDANAKLSELIERKVGDISTNISDIEGLKNETESLSEEIESNEKQLDEARRTLNRVYEWLNEQRNELEMRKRDQAIALAGGTVVTAFPVVGWIAGPLLVAASVTKMADEIKASENKVKSAEGEARSCENLWSEKKKKRDDLQRELSQKNAEKQETEKKLEALQAEVRHLREEQKSSTDVQEKLRNTCHFMTKISGKSNVLEMETLNAFWLEPLFTLLREIAMIFTFKEHDKLKVTSLLFNDMDFTGLSLKLKAIYEKTQDETLNPTFSLETLFTLVKENTRMFSFAIQEHYKLTTLLFNEMNFTGSSLKLKAISGKPQHK